MKNKREISADDINLGMFLVFIVAFISVSAVVAIVADIVTGNFF